MRRGLLVSFLTVTGSPQEGKLSYWGENLIRCLNISLGSYMAIGMPFMLGSVSWKPQNHLSDGEVC